MRRRPAAAAAARGSFQLVAPSTGMFFDQATCQSTLESIANVPLAAEIDGRIVSMAMAEGQMVRRGDLLFRLDQVQLQAEGSRRQTIQRLENLYVPAAGGALIPLANLVRLRLDSAPPIISHFDLNRTVLIQGFEAIGRSTGQAIAALSTAFQQLNLSTIGMDWSALSRSEVAAGSLAVLVFALGPVVVYLVLSAQYGSYIDPLVILMTVPLAILGALLFLVLNRQANNVYAQVGMVTLIGLAAKNGILIVDLANQRMEAGLSDVEAAMGAAQSRLRPILMTASAALSGFFPLVVVLVAGGCGAWGEAMRQLAAIESPADPEA
jgi:HAE1 family hydrophobic/amphiphilic exporter-1